MKNIILIIVALGVLFAFLLVSDKKDKKTEKEINNSPQQQESSEDKKTLFGSGKYVIDVNSSDITWESKKTFIKEWIDNGKIKINSGEITLLEDKISEAQIIVDMNSIQAENTGKGDGQDSLSRHLKSADFFDVENFPTANFVLNSVIKNENDSQYLYDAEGNLTIKGITKTISFPIGAYVLNNNLIIEGEIVVDRTDFDVKFGSPNFFKDIGNNAIDNNFILKLKLVAQKA